MSKNKKYLLGSLVIAAFAFTVYGAGTIIRYDNFIFKGTFSLDQLTGMDINPGSDTDIDLVTVGVTGAPTLSWDETNDAFSFNNDLIVSSLNGVIKGTSGLLSASDVDLTSEVTGALPIGNGGTGQTTQTAAFNALSPTTTKGDLIISDGTNNVRAPACNNGEILIYASGETLGVECGSAPSASSWVVNAIISGGNGDMGFSDVSSPTGIESTTWTLTNTSAATINANITCSGTNAPTGTTCSSGSESLGVSFDLPSAGTVQACVAFTHQLALDAQAALPRLDVGFQIVETPTNAQTVSQEGNERTVSGLTNPLTSGNTLTIKNPVRVCGLLVFGTSGTKAVRLFYEMDENNSPAGQNFVRADAAAALGEPVVTWRITPL